jgi:hypothetical protein
VALALPRELVLELLNASTATTTHTVATLAVQMHRSGSTLRCWLEAGLFPGAFQLPGAKRPGAWRIPQSAVEAFEARLRAARASGSARRDDRAARVDARGRPPRVEAPPDLGAWRRVRGKTA